MKRPEFRAFAREDFPDAPWIEKLIRPLNTVLGAVATGLGNGLTLGENLNAEIRTLDITTRDEWVRPTLQNGWLDFGAPYELASYAKIAGRVFLRGSLKSGTLNTDAFTLPSDCAPAAQLSFAVQRDASAAAFGQIIVYPSGAVRPTVGSNTFYGLDGISFYVGGSLPNPAFPVRFTTKVKGRVAGVLILRCVELDGRNERAVNDSLSAGWAQAAQQIELNSVAGLAGGKTYRLTLAVLGG